MIAVRHGRPAVRTRKAWIAASLLVVAASCDDWCPGRKHAKSAQELVPRTLAAVIVTPSSASLAVGETQQFSVTGLMSDGTYASVTVHWTATSGTVSAIGLYTAGTTTGTFRVIAVQQGGTLEDTSTVTVNPSGPTSSGGDVVQVVGVPETQEKWLLQDSNAGGTCPSDLVTLFTGLELSLGVSDAACATQLAAFAAGAAPVLDRTPAWTAGSDVIPEGLPPRWEVRLHVVIEYNEAEDEAKAEASLVSHLFDANRMGILLMIAGGTTKVDPAIDPLAEAIRGGCSTVAAKPELNFPSELTVIYVLEEDWGFDGDFGHSCVDKNLPGIIFIRQAHVAETLAHEVGHSLSLHHAGYSSNELKGWPATNLMRNGIWDPEPKTPNPTVNSFSLGQAYRANFNDASWLNSAAGPRAGLPKEACQDGAAPGDSHVHWPCPNLQLGWP